MYYVYLLIDPRSDEVFYVGKGTGNRIDAHEKEALRGVRSKKCRRINEIVSSGNAVIKEKVFFTDDETLAYEFEKDIISEKGLENLTNVIPGGKWDKEKLEALRQAVKAASAAKKREKELVSSIAEIAKLTNGGGRDIVLFDGKFSLVKDMLNKFIHEVVSSKGIDWLNGSLKPYKVEIVHSAKGQEIKERVYPYIFSCSWFDELLSAQR